MLDRLRRALAPEACALDSVRVGAAAYVWILWRRGVRHDTSRPVRATLDFIENLAQQGLAPFRAQLADARRLRGEAEEARPKQGSGGTGNRFVETGQDHQGGDS